MLEQSTTEIDLLYLMSNKLVLAETPQQQLEAVSDYARLYGATQGILFYIENPDAGMVERVQVVAEWFLDDRHEVGIGNRFEVSQLNFIQNLLKYPASSVLIEDIQICEDVDPDFLARLKTRNVHASAILPMNNHGSWMGILWFVWNVPHRFARQDEQIYTTMLQHIVPVIDSHRLLEQMRQRTLELEEANQELNLLYRTSEIINSANTYEEVLEAVSHFDTEAEVVSLMLWENRNWATADYLDIVAVIDRAGQSIVQSGDRLPKDNFPVAQVMLNERTWIFEDAENDPRIDSFTLENWKALGILSFFGTALYIEQRWLGGVTYYSNRPRPYTERQKRLLAGIGDIVLGAVERIRLKHETETSRRRAEILARINGMFLKASDEIDIMDAIATYTSTLGIYGMSLVYIDTDQVSGERWWRPVSVWHEGKSYVYDAAKFPEVQYINAEIATMWTHQPYDPFFVENIVNDPRFSDESRKHFMEHLPVRGFVLIPLVIGLHYHGILRITWLDPHHFSDFERSIFYEFLRVLPFVVASRRNYLAERQQANELEAIARVTAVATSILDEDELLQSICDLTHQQLSDYVINIFTVDEQKGILHWRNIAEPETIYLTDASSPGAYVARERKSLIINDIHRTTEYVFETVHADVRSLMSLPIVASDKVIGVLEIQSTQINRFSTTDLRIMGALGDLIAVAIQNTRLYQRSLSYAVLEERNRLARELHDSVSQALYGIVLSIKTGQFQLANAPDQIGGSLDYALNLSQAALSEMRALIFELRPETLEQAGLIGALNRQVEMIQARYEVSVYCDMVEEPRVALSMKENIYWIAREALHNVVKHARASHIKMCLKYKDGVLELTIIDDGIGFDTSQNFTGHLGLRSMSERTTRLEGTLTIESAPGQGTTVRLWTPIPKLKTLT